jgi:hypothetical protein
MLRIQACSEPQMDAECVGQSLEVAAGEVPNSVELLEAR